MERYDVAVIGAGLAGLRCAGALAEGGRRVLLVDRKTSVTSSIHTTGIFVKRTLESYRLPEQALGPPVRRVVLYSPRRRPLVMDSEHDEFRVGRMDVLYSTLLEECIQRGVRWRAGARFAGCRPRSEGSTIRFASGEATQHVRARFVIGADGATSDVASSLGLDMNRRWIVGVEDVLEDVPLQGPPAFHCFLDPGLAPGYLAWVVDDGEQAHVGVGGYAGRFDALRALETFTSTLGAVVDLRRARRVERRGGRIPVGGVLRRIASTRGLLVGDAAGAPSPLTAGGLDPCMRLSELAVRVTDAFLSTGDASVLDEYSGSRFRARFAARLGMRWAFERLSNAYLLEVACGILRRGPFVGVARHVFFGRGSFPDIEDATSPAPSSRSAERALPLSGSSVLRAPRDVPPYVS